MNVSTRNPAPFAVLGLLIAFAFAAILIVAINGDASWVYGENTLSDLGISDVELSQNLFYYGCLIIGILTIVFGFGKAVCETGCNRASGCMAAFAGIFLVLVAVFDKSYGNGNLHELVAVLTFLFLFLAMVLSAIGDWKAGSRLTGAVTAVLILIPIGCCVGMSLASLEVIFVACALLWIVVASAGMILNSRKV